MAAWNIKCSLSSLTLPGTSSRRQTTGSTLFSWARSWNTL